MASIDYGTVLVKNGELIDTKEVMKRTDMGIPFDRIVSNIVNDHNVDFSGSVIIGDEDFCITFWKTHATIIICGHVCGQIWYGRASSFASNDFHISTKAPYERRFNVFNSGVDIIIESIDPAGCMDDCGYRYYSDKYHIYFEYKGNRYDIYTGYGIDADVDVYNDIKFDHYGYTETERCVLDKVFGIV